MTDLPTVGRRRFLALAALPALGGAPAPGGVDWAGLKRAMAGSLVRPGEAGYPAATTPFNAALGVRRPAAVARVASRTDVSTCIRRAAGRGIPLAARSGGHSYLGYSTPDGGLVIDVSALDAVTVRADGTAVVGAGARLGNVYRALAAHGRAVPTGSCPTVGVAGLTLGGGIGVLARAYGLTCDHLLAATVVTADGRRLTVNGNHNHDLFWALRGGGGGNGGIVTDFTFSTVPAPTVTVFRLAFPADGTARVLRAWSAWIGAVPDGLSALCAVTAGLTPTHRLTGTWTGAPAALSAHLSALIAEVGVTPASQAVRTYGYLDAMKYFAGTPGRQAFRAASRMLEHPLTTSAAEQIVELLRNRTGLVLLFDSLGGQVAQLHAADTAFVHRQARASVQIYSGSAAAGPAVAQVQRALAPLVGTGAYVNYLNPDQADWATAYYGRNLGRLRRVIKHYDPAGAFSFAQSVLRA